MGRVRLTPRADADLEDIWFHTALDNPGAADRAVDRVASRCRDLVEHPRLRPARPDIAPGARMLVVGDCLSLYRLVDEGLEIVRVVHGARRLEGLFDAGLAP